MRNIRIKLITDLIVYPRRDNLPPVRFKRGTQLNAIIDDYGFVDVVLPRHMCKRLTKQLGKEVKPDSYGYKEHNTILGRNKPTKYTKRIYVDYIDKNDEGLSFKIVRG